MADAFSKFGEVPQRVKIVNGRHVPLHPEECEPHTPGQPDGVAQWHDWRIEMEKTHVQRQCKGCGLWDIWELKPAGGAPEILPLTEALAVIKKVDAHLDSSASPDYAAQPLAQDWARITKVCEEAGEVWRALSKATGENFRKGVCGTEEELLGELADTASAALCAIQHRTKDTGRTWAIVSAALLKAAERVDAAKTAIGSPS